MLGDCLRRIEKQYTGTPLYAEHEGYLRDSAGVAYMGALYMLQVTLISFKMSLVY